MKLARTLLTGRLWSGVSELAGERPRLGGEADRSSDGLFSNIARKFLTPPMAEVLLPVDMSVGVEERRSAKRSRKQRCRNQHHARQSCEAMFLPAESWNAALEQAQVVARGRRTETWNVLLGTGQGEERHLHETKNSVYPRLLAERLDEG